MKPERWQQIKELTADALETSVAERPAFLAAACADDPDLQREVESLLAAGERKGLETFANDLAWSRAEQRDARLGQNVGAYRIVRPIGRGGMGAVYLAERADREFEKQVALKILKRGTDTDEVLRRFQRERQILAQLAHPNIAHLLDAGTTEDGLPFFAMEYVSGTPITDFCEAQNLPLRARLDLFLKVCGAVEFAHRNLIVHRDLKPANILVTADGEPKLLDFGIAKLLAPDAADFELTLQDRQRLTPAYASPEQVRGEAVTTVSDVYALGALLYELLTGQTPHRFATPHPTETEMVRVIVDGAPAAASSVTQKRELRGDLDNILITALRKEPERRYSGVAAFADDLRRFLAQRPVRAQPDTIGYRAAKFMQRNRLAVAAAALVVTALVVGLGVAAWQAQVARAEKANAVARFNEVRQLARSVLFDYHDAIAALPGSTAVRERLVSDALQYLDRLSSAAEEDVSLVRELAEAYEKVAAVQGGFLLSNTGALVSASNLGDANGALKSQRKALVLREKLTESAQPKAKDLQALAANHNALGSLTWAVGTVQETAAHFRKALSLVEPLLAQDPANEELLTLAAVCYNNFGKVLGSPVLPNLGDTAGALENLRKCLAISEKLVADHPGNLGHLQSLCSSYNALGIIHQSNGDTKAQLAASLQALEINRAMTAAAPDNVYYQRELAVQLGNLGSAMVQAKDKAGALPFFREALALFEKLAAADPNDFAIRRALAVGYRNVGVAVGVNDPAEAMRQLRKANDILVELVERDGKNVDYRRQWAFTHLATSRFQAEADDLPAAVASAHEGIKIEEALVADAPADVSAQTTLALLYRQLGLAEAQWGGKAELPSEAARAHWQNARQAYAKCLAVYEGLKSKGKLAGADAAKPAELASEIAKCDAALRALSS